MKKVLAIVLAMVLALCAMSISVFADEIVLFDNAEGDTLGIVDPWDGFGIGVSVNGHAVGDLTVEDLRALAAAGGAKLVFEFSCTAISTWQTTSPEAQFNCWDTEEALQVNTELTDLGDGRYQATVAFDDLVANLEAAGLTTDSINNLGIQVWCENFTLYSAKIVTGDDATVDEAPVDETPVDEPADTPVDETPVDEAPVDEAPVEEAPAETGLALAVLPAVIALAVVTFKKR